VQPMGAVAVAVVRALAWIALASELVAAPAASAELQTAAAPPAIGPYEVMSDLSTRLFADLDRKDSTPVRHNADKVLPLLDRLLSPHFDIQYTGRLVLGLHWRGATSEQRQHLAVALYQRLLRTYAGAVAEWTADRVKLLPLHADTAALQVTVHTLVTNPHGVAVSVDYRLHQTGEDWKIFDVVVDGVSYVRIYHDDTDAEVTQKGLDGAIARLERLDTGAIESARPRDPVGPQK
jgi:phospholipid transport system substrate-binding protein